MGAAFRNSQDYRYSTPYGTVIGGPTDWRDGAGVFGLGPTTFRCDPVPGIWIDGGDKDIDLTNGEPVPWESPWSRGLESIGGRRGRCCCSTLRGRAWNIRRSMSRRRRCGRW